MKSIMVEVTCPYCGRVTHRKSETLLISGFETRFDEALKAGKFFIWHCPVCGKENSFLHPLLYVDKVHGYVLLIKNEKDLDASDQRLYHEQEHMIKRYIFREEEVGEKIRILNDGLDDRVVELIKAKLLLQYQRRKKPIQDITYRDYDSLSQTLWFTIVDEESKVIGVEYTVYEGMRHNLTKPIAEFQMINITWAIQEIKKLEKQQK